MAVVSLTAGLIGYGLAARGHVFFKKCCAPKQASPVPKRMPSAAHTGKYLRFRVSLSYIEPPIWREILLRGDATFFDLHAAIQACGWTDSHLWHFTSKAARGAIAGIPDDDGIGPPAPDAEEVQLASHFLNVGDDCSYTYDFGDNWEHHVILEGYDPCEEDFERALLGGEGAFPPEDCGGVPGFLRLRAYQATGVDPWGNTDELREWAEAFHMAPFDLAQEQLRFGWVLTPRQQPIAEVPSGASRGSDSGSATSPAGVPLPVIDKATMDTIALSLDATLGRISEELGLSVRMRRASYSQINAKIELEVAVVGEDGLILDKEAEQFLDRCHDFGLESSDLGRPFLCGEVTYRIVGLRPRAKSPVICQPMGVSDDSGRVRMSAEAVRSHFAEQVDSGPKLRLLGEGE